MNLLLGRLLLLAQGVFLFYAFHAFMPSKMSWAEAAGDLPERVFDEVILNNGTRFKGIVEKEDDSSLALKTAESSLRLTFKRGDQPENLKEILRRFTKQDSYRKEAEQAGNDVQKRFQLGQKCKKAGLTEEYLQELWKAIEFDPKFSQAYHELLAHHRQENDLEGELKVCLEAKKAGVAAPEFLLRLGEIYQQIRLNAWALREFQSLQKQDPGHSLARVREAEVLAAMGKRREAGEIFEDLLKKNPKLPEALDGHGVLAFGRGQYSLAKGSFEAAIAVRADDPASRFHLGITYLAVGQPQEALQQFEKIPPDSPLSGPAGLNKAMVHAALGYPEKAEEVFKSVETSASPGQKKLVQAFLLEHRSEAEGPTQAISVYQEILKDRPEDFLAEVGLARALLAGGQVPLALESFQKILDKNPVFWAAHLLLGLHLIRQEKAQEAIPHLEKTKEIQSGLAMEANGDLLFAVGYACFKEAKLDEAKRSFAAALKEDEDHEAASAGLKEIAARLGEPATPEAEAKPEGEAGAASEKGEKLEGAANEAMTEPGGKAEEQPAKPAATEEMGEAEKTDEKEKETPPKEEKNQPGEALKPEGAGEAAGGGEAAEAPAATRADGAGEGETKENPKSFEELAAECLESLRVRASSICWILPSL